MLSGPITKEFLEVLIALILSLEVKGGWAVGFCVGFSTSFQFTGKFSF